MEIKQPPSRILVTKIKKGNYYDAINSNHGSSFHVPSIEEIKIAIKYSEFPFLQNKPYISSDLVENSDKEIKSLIYVNYYNKYDFKEITIEKDSNDTYYFLINIEYD